MGQTAKPHALSPVHTGETSGKIGRCLMTAAITGVEEDGIGRVQKTSARVQEGILLQ